MRNIILSVLNSVLLLVIIILLVFTMRENETQTMSPDQIRELAASYKSNDLFQPAVKEYERYLEMAPIPAEQRANILYTIGNIYLEELQQYENALAVYMKISELYPQTRIAPEAEKRMVRCYENLERSFDAQKKLERLTALDEEETQPATSTVVANVGKKEITLEQIEREIDQLPDYRKQNLQNPEQKLEYLKNKIFAELLYDKALRNEYNKDPEVRKQLQNVEKQLLAQKVMEEEINQKIQIAPSDIELYYQANQEEFTQPQKLKIAHIQVESEEKAQEVKQALDEGLEFEEAVQQYSTDEATQDENGLLGEIREDQSSIPGLGEAKKTIAHLLRLEPNEISEPLPSAKGFHIFRVLERTPGKVQPLEQVRDQVRHRVQMMKQQEATQQLLEELMQAENVTLYENRILQNQP